MADSERAETVDLQSDNEPNDGPEENKEDKKWDNEWRSKQDEGVLKWVKRFIYIGGQAAALAGMSIYLLIGRDDLSLFEKHIMICTAAAFNLRECITLFYTQRHRFIDPKPLIGLPIGWFFLYGLPSFCYNLPNQIVGPRQASISTWSALSVCSVSITLLGHIFNSFAELQRKLWLDKPENKGKLYTRGLFALCRHPNYLGDLLIFTGWYLLSRNWIPFLMVIIMIYSFYKEYIPEIEDFLANEFGQEWIEYTKKVKPMIPFIC